MKRTIRSITIFLTLCLVLVACAPAVATQAPAATQAPGSTQAPVSGEGVTLELWGFQYSDPFNAWLKAACDQFILDHPEVKAINQTQKNDADLEAGLIAAAAAGELPDIFINAVGFGAANVQAGVLNNIYDRWNAMPDSYKSQFTPGTVASVTPEDGVMYALPFTGYGYVLYRNLTVLKAAGIDPTVPLTTNQQWLDQMKQVSDAGYLAVPNFTTDIRAVRIMYNSFTPDPLNEWGIDFANNKSLINPDAWVSEAEWLLKVKPYASEASFGDQSITDLFSSNKLAFTIGGPWVNPTWEAAKAATGLDYDFAVIPGVTPDRVSDVSGGEYISINTNGPNADLAWELATYLSEAEQMYISAQDTGQTNQNEVAMAKVTNPLVKVVFQGLSTGPVLYDSPPFFVEPYPDNYEQTIVNNMNAIYEGKMAPQEGADQLIPELNQLIADRNK